MNELQECFDRDFDVLYDELIEDIDLLGDIQLQESTNLIIFADFCRLNTLIKKYTHPTMVPTLKVLIESRRALLDVNMVKYRELALLFCDYEEIFTQKVSDVILEHFKID